MLSEVKSALMSNQLDALEFSVNGIYDRIISLSDRINWQSVAKEGKGNVDLNTCYTSILKRIITKAENIHETISALEDII